jgi:hypothetical protein
VRAGAVVLTVVAASAHAHADDRPDPAAERAADANLESIEHRQGIVFGAALGPSVTIGGGTGTGGDLALRIGHVATPTTVLDFVLGGSAQFHKDLNKQLVANNLTYALVGAQYWVARALWLRIGAGGGTYHCNECLMDGSPKNTKRAGPAGGVGAGVDLVRYHGVVLDLEVYSIGVISRDGFLTTSGMSLGLSFD